MILSHEASQGLFIINSIDALSVARGADGSGSTLGTLTEPVVTRIAEVIVFGSIFIGSITSGEGGNEGVTLSEYEHAADKRATNNRIIER